MSPKNTLSGKDVKEWILQTAIYSLAIPATIVTLTSLQNGLDLKAALIAGAYSIISALVNLLMKLSAGVPTTETPAPVQ